MEEKSSSTLFKPKNIFIIILAKYFCHCEPQQNSGLEVSTSIHQGTKDGQSDSFVNTSNTFINLKTNDITDPLNLLQYLDLQLKIERIEEKLDRRENFDFSIVNFPFVCSNISSGVKTSLLTSQQQLRVVCSIHFSNNIIIQSQ